jgi:single-stranded-DNA-specific exonuclease
MRDDRWVVVDCDQDVVERLSRECGYSRVLSRLLVNRGVTTSGEAERFLNPSIDHLHDPSLLPDLEHGVDRLLRAVTSGERIRIHGDYDVDGITGTALLVRTISALKGNVDYKLPHRRREGYDIKPESVEEAASEGVGLIVTCDCGVNACESAKRARELGVDLIVTDHHEPPDVLPDALAVINPKRLDAAYPFPELAGVGVAFKLAQGLVRRLGLNEEAFQTRFLDLAALGTVGDVVPLLGENRAIVSHGLEAIPKSRKVGLQTILRATKLDGKPMTAYYLGYVIGPRLNAAGRMDDATTALRLLLTRDETEANQLAAKMERHNAERRAEQERILREAMEQAESKDLDAVRVLVLSSEEWNTGVIGVVAGKICECYGRPAILISRNESTGEGRGSARSDKSFDIVEGLRACHRLLTHYGGHALAAGLSIPLANLDRFEEEINAIACEAIEKEELPPKFEVEAELEAKDITRDLAASLLCLEPFGMGNPEPLFATRGLVVGQKQRVGGGSHLRMQLLAEGEGPIKCIAFGMGEMCDSIPLGGKIDLCYTLRLDSYNGYESVQLVGKDIRVSS